MATVQKEFGLESVLDSLSHCTVALWELMATGGWYEDFIFYYRRKIIFSEGIVCSYVCDFFFFLSVTTITLERLKQSELNFHT